MKRFTCLALAPKTTLFVYAEDETAAALKAYRAGYTVGDVRPAGEWDPVANVIIEAVVHMNGKGNGANGHHANGAGHR